MLALPALRALAASLPRPSLLIAGSGPQEFITANAGFDEQLLVSFRRNGGTTEFDWQAVLPRASRCEVFVSLCPYKSASISALWQALGAARSVGLGPPCAEIVDYLKPGHECDVLFSVAQQFTPQQCIETYAVPLCWPQRTAETSAKVRSSIPPGGTLLVAHLDSTPAKSWPAALIDAALVEILAARRNVYAVVLNAGAENLPAATATGRAAALNGLTLDRAMSLVSTADIFVGVDSCMLHVADLFRRPGVALFASTSAERFGFRWTASERVRHLHAARIEDHAPARVAAAAIDLLGDSPVTSMVTRDVNDQAAASGRRG